MDNSPCVHWMVFPAPSGKMVTGVCKYCGATQTVPTLGVLRTSQHRPRPAFASGSRTADRDLAGRMQQAQNVIDYQGPLPFRAPPGRG